MKHYIFVILVFLSTSLNADSSKPYIMPSLFGQLGNQMFQIAAATSLALDHNARVIIPDLKQQTQWDIPVNAEIIFSKLDSSNPNVPVEFAYVEPHYPHQDIPYHPNMSLWGYFQSDKYFSKHKEAIIELFSPSAKILKYLNKKYKAIMNHPKTVAVHVRTYHKDGENKKFFYENGREYVNNAMKIFPDDYLFVIFSDDIPWTKIELAHLRPNMVFISGEKHFFDFYLMSLCKHNIISNSSFSWWAAYLNPNPDKIVVAPKKWFTPLLGVDYQDLYPEDWLQMD